ncbi:hypothetical protein ESCO_000203 [Escovopsis weberi]|uniref:Uncharacterized protein n=1 Tax=Escovopsis weberi TaxID=150374 RepID=A0A0M9VTF8_ESCWE|nr:hypothetical protein ESCO_000203 [Escovopsis weberi]
MKTVTALSSILLLLLARGAVASPPGPRDVDACCCCVPGKNVISCTNAIKAKDCVCLAVVCPKGAPTIWEKPKRPQATSTVTLAPDMGLGPAEPAADYRHHPTAPVSAEASILTAAPSPQAPLKDIVLVESRVAAPTLPVAPPAELEVEVEVEAGGSSELAPCCCCDVRHENYSCHMRKKRDCFCGQVVCPSRAPTVWNNDDAEPTAGVTQRIGTVW